MAFEEWLQEFEKDIDLINHRDEGVFVTEFHGERQQLFLFSENTLRNFVVKSFFLIK